MLKLNSKPDVTQAAEDVLSAFRYALRVGKDSHRALNGWISCENYINGRERGYSLQANIIGISDVRKVSFSEYRNTDQIVIYFGESMEFENGTNVPHEHIYRNAKFLAPDQIEEAAAFIFGWLVLGRSDLKVAA